MLSNQEPAQNKPPPAFAPADPGHDGVLRLRTAIDSRSNPVATARCLASGARLAATQQSERSFTRKCYAILAVHAPASAVCEEK